jgi:nucleotide-binding universal stress UspA family protein
MKVVIGYDGSPSSDELWDDLRYAGLPQQAEAIVISAAEFHFPNWLEITAGAQSELVGEIELAQKEALERATTLAKKGAEKLRGLFPEWVVNAEAHHESPASALLSRAQEWNADLIVVGARGHSRLSLFLGSVSQLVLIQAHCSVRISRGNKKSTERPKIIIGVDGSQGAEKAVKAFCLRAWPTSTEVNVISSYQSHTSIKLVHILPPDIRKKSSNTHQEKLVLDRLMGNITGQMKEKNIKALSFIYEGDPKRILVDEAKKRKADCIFLGARGLSPSRRFLLGSVSMAVAARAHCSVEIVRL